LADPIPLEKDPLYPPPQITTRNSILGWEGGRSEEENSICQPTEIEAELISYFKMMLVIDTLCMYFLMGSKFEITTYSVELCVTTINREKK